MKCKPTYCEDRLSIYAVHYGFLKSLLYRATLVFAHICSEEWLKLGIFNSNMRKYLCRHVQFPIPPTPNKPHNPKGTGYPFAVRGQQGVCQRNPSFVIPLALLISKWRITRWSPQTPPLICEGGGWGGDVVFKGKEGFNMMIVTLSCGCSYRLSLSACPECMEDVGDVFRCATHGITCITKITEQQEGYNYV